MKKKILLILMLSLVMLVSACNINSDQGQIDLVEIPNEVLEYSSGDLGITLNYPDNWTYVEGDSEVTFYHGYDEATENATAYVNVSIADVQDELNESGTSIEDIKDQMVDSITSDKTMSVDNVEEVSVMGDLPCYKMDITSKNSSGNALKMNRAIFSDYGYLYVVTYGARASDYDKFNRDYDTMLSSFDVISFALDENGNIKEEE